jgi:hypothetical protein
MSASRFFNSVEDHLLALLFSHLPGVDVARLASVCTRWREIVQGEGSDDAIWKILWKRDFEPFIPDSPASTVGTDGESARTAYCCMAAIDQLANPMWTQLHPTNGHNTVMDRQGSSAAVLNGCPVVYGGWTSGWDTIRNDVHVLRRRGCKLEWDAILCEGSPPPPSYGPTLTSLVHPLYGACLAAFGGVLYGSYQGPINELRLLVPNPAEFERKGCKYSQAEESSEGGGGGVHKLGTSSSERCPWKWINPPQRSEIAGGDFGNPRAYHTMTYLPAGLGGCKSPRLLVFGGFADESALAGLQVAQLARGASANAAGAGSGKEDAAGEHVWEWSGMVTVGAAPCARFGHSATLCGPDNSRLFVVGGCTGGHNHKGRGTHGDELKDVYVLALDSDVPVWSQPDISGSLPSAALARCHSAVLIASNILFFGGGPSYRLTNDVLALDTRNMCWKPLSPGLASSTSGTADESSQDMDSEDDDDEEGEGRAPAGMAAQLLGSKDRRKRAPARPDIRQNAIFVALSGGAEVILYGGWKGGEMGDTHVLRFEGLRRCPAYKRHASEAEAAGLGTAAAEVGAGETQGNDRGDDRDVFPFTGGDLSVEPSARNDPSTFFREQQKQALVETALHWMHLANAGHPVPPHMQGLAAQLGIFLPGGMGSWYDDDDDDEEEEEEDDDEDEVAGDDGSGADDNDEEAAPGAASSEVSAREDDEAGTSEAEDRRERQLEEAD